MGLLGNGWDDPQSQAIMALSGGLLRGDFGGGLLGANQAYAHGQDSIAKKQYMQMQMADMQQQAELRKAQVAALARKQSILDGFLNGGGGAPAPAMPGQLGSGSFGVVPPANGAPAIPAAQPQGMGAAGRLNPDTLMRLKLGADVDLTDIYKLTRPDMQVANGFVYDKNTVKPGFLPGMQVTPDGKGVVTMPGANGLPQMAPMAGSLDTYGQFQDRSNLSTARATPEKVVGPDGAERFVPRSQVLGMETPPAAPQGAARTPLTLPGDADRAAIFDQEMKAAQARLSAAKTPEEINRATNDLAALRREISALPAAAQPASFQATPTTAQAASKAAAIKQAETDVAPTAQRKNDLAGANYMLSVIDQAISHPGRETATGLSGTLDPRNYLPGTNAKGFQSVLDQIRGGTFMQAYQNLKGGGQITEIEGKKAENALARLNTAQSDGEFLSALKEFRQVVSNGMLRAKSGMEGAGMATQFPGDNREFTGGATGSWGDAKPNTLNELPKTAPKGQRVRDTATGKVLQFNGLSWVEVK